jgi:hypothetical protein
MKRLLAGFFILLLAACGSSASGSPTADLPALIPPSLTPPSDSASTEETAPPDLPQEGTSILIPSTDQPSSLTQPVCIDSLPTQADIDRALAFPGEFFETGDWERTYTVASDKVLVSWYSASIPSIVNLEALIFPCSYEEPDLDAFYNVDAWAIIFGNYQSYEYLNECRNDQGLRLYHFIAVDQGLAYQVRYWVLNDTPTRVISFMVVLPVDAETQMDEIAYTLFPQLTGCE